MGDFDDFCDLNNPVNQLVVAVMENCIVFEQKICIVLIEILINNFDGWLN